MQNTDTPSAEALREQVSAVSERYVAVDCDGETVVFDASEPDGWIVSDAALDREAMR